MPLRTRNLRKFDLAAKERNATSPVYVSIGRAEDVMEGFKKFDPSSYYALFQELEFPPPISGLSQRDRSNVLKVYIEFAVEMYKGMFISGELVEYDPVLRESIYRGGAIQRALNALGQCVARGYNSQRLQTLKLAIRGAAVSASPQVYLALALDGSVGIYNYYAQSVFRLDGRAKPDPLNFYFSRGTSNKGPDIYHKNDSPQLKSCDALTIKDPRFLSIQESCSYENKFKDVLISNAPKWKKSLCFEILSHLYSIIRLDCIQDVPHMVENIMENKDIPTQVADVFERIKSDHRGQKSPLTNYFTVIQNCLESSEAIASEVLTSHMLSIDLIPRPQHYRAHYLPCLFKAKSFREVSVIRENYLTEPSSMIIHSDSSKCVSASTKKKARLASLLYSSDTVSSRLECPPQSTRNTKELEEPPALQDKINKNGEADMMFFNDLVDLFGVCEEGPDLLSDVRLEHVDGFRPSGGIPTGPSADCCNESGGLPPNDLQNFVRKMGYEKAMKSPKRRKLCGMFSPSALTAVSVLVEELASEVVLSWQDRLSKKRYANASDASEVPPLEYNHDFFSREVELQLRGVDLDCDHDAVERLLQNRMEVLFGNKDVRTPENLELMHTQLLIEQERQKCQQDDLHHLLFVEGRRARIPAPSCRFKTRKRRSSSRAVEDEDHGVDDEA